ncbi:MAG: nucleotide sugar dehydrogenase, partial [Proteobacteria bacterium]|nr:nucleotide sugar dehydrogenase [Pseudomonadota bacterium]
MSKINLDEYKICVIGLGYVGLPVAIEFSRVFKHVVGFDINKQKIADLKNGVDSSGEVSTQDLKSSNLVISDQADAIRDCNFFIVAVPTPVDSAKIPDFSPLVGASETVGRILKKGDVVVYESTVYPGATEEVCAPILAKHSKLVPFKDFKLGYSPERINPGDKERTLTKITKVVSGQDAETLNIVASVYGAVIKAGVYKAASIKVAEAAKVIENTQRDLNIALVNELALVFDKIGIRTKDVLEAAGTKWNFLKFTPGLVGGHCIGVDPYYLTYKATQLGYHPDVILAGRRINDSIGSFIATKTIKLMLKRGIDPKSASVLIMGVTFKEDVNDIRNSKVPDIAKELMEFGVTVQMYDPLANKAEFRHEYDLNLIDETEIRQSDCIIFAVPHR